MPLTIGLAYNEKPAELDEPPGSPSRSDRYAEWDEPDTIAAVEAALSRAGRVVRLEADESFPERLRAARPDVVFNIAEALNGPNREAHVPAICEFLGVPYTGSDPLALCVGLDKRRAKEAFVARRVPTPEWVVLAPAALDDVATAGTGVVHSLPADFPLPAVVKPLYEGSSMGVTEASFCRSREAVLDRAAAILRDYGQPALVERFLPGREFTVAILGNGAEARALPIVEIRFDALPEDAAPIYGYEAKWVWDTTEQPLQIFRCPAPLASAEAAAVELAALGAFHALGCRDWARVDVRMDDSGRPQVIEINPLPGILPDPRQNSCFPKAARAAGMDYDGMLLAVLDAALARLGIPASEAERVVA